MEKGNKKFKMSLVKWLVVFNLLFLGGNAVMASQAVPPTGHALGNGEPELIAIGKSLGWNYSSYDGEKVKSEFSGNKYRLELKNVVFHDFELR